MGGRIVFPLFKEKKRNKKLLTNRKKKGDWKITSSHAQKEFFTSLDCVVCNARVQRSVRQTRQPSHPAVSMEHFFILFYLFFFSFCPTSHDHYDTGVRLIVGSPRSTGWLDSASSSSAMTQWRACCIYIYMLAGLLLCLSACLSAHVFSFSLTAIHCKKKRTS